ncbi:hypothetical protein IW261DRAFT_1424597 [Armillaria novae-zelandiae]|uniref:Uncharacterized protein n=1 Tax=Armillaria novae-zelandiae TaxID=153914 RepID=A0AA39NV17_9AGAR|nr:hypothetical protein IW261DRAFT_1424597 [Armillaria novae-zelandiae]
MVPEEMAIAKSKSPGAFTWDNSNDAMPWLTLLLKTLSGAISLRLTSFQEVSRDDVLPLAEPIIASDGEACSIAIVDYLATFTAGAGNHMCLGWRFGVLKGAPELQHGPVVLLSIPWFWGKQKKDHRYPLRVTPLDKQNIPVAHMRNGIEVPILDLYLLFFVEPSLLLGVRFTHPPPELSGLLGI